MIELARKNAARANATNVEFRLSKITELRVEDSTADCVISNCVLNLVADSEKRVIFSEIHRILKPGGRMAVSDFLALKPLPVEMKNDPALFAGCVAGAIEVPDMQKYLKEAGFQGLRCLR
jgi:arsenite methyltransferase